jgi:nucleotide-binding universal stress UspA family protein
MEVLGHAAAFASATGNRLHLFRVLDPLLDVEMGTEPPSDAIASVVTRWQAEMAAHLAETGLAGETSVRVLRSGQKVHGEICQAASELEADMIALSSHGAGLIRHAVLGSVAMGVVGTSDLPLLVAGPKAGDPPVPGHAYRVLIASDGSEASASILAVVAKLPGIERLTLTLARVYEPQLGDRGDKRELTGAVSELKELAKTLPPGAPTETIVDQLREFERVDHAIIRLAEQAGTQAIAMATHGYTRARHVFAGSVTLGALQHSTLPLIIARSS